MSSQEIQKRFFFRNPNQLEQFLQGGSDVQLEPLKSSRQARVVFMGTPEFAVPTLKNLIREDWNLVGVVTQPDRPAGRRMKLTPPPVKVIAQEHHLPVYQWETLRNADTIKELSELKPDLILTAAYGLFLPEEVLQLPTYGCLNLHPSLLPLYRGSSPVAQALLNGDQETGVTVMKTALKMDAGDLVGVCRYPIPDAITQGELTEELSRLGADLLVALLPDWIRKQWDTLPQDPAQVTFSKKWKREDGVIYFDQPVQKIRQLIQASTPWPGAQAQLEQGRIKFLSVGKIERPSPVPAGQIVIRDKEFWISGQDGILQILSLQLPSGKKLQAAECAHNFKTGMEFFRLPVESSPKF